MDAKLIEWGFKGLLTGGVGLAVWQLKVIAAIISEMKSDLIRFSERMNWHKEKIDNHEVRITKLEDGKNARR